MAVKDLNRGESRERDKGEVKEFGHEYQVWRKKHAKYDA
jgi:hypothetical protein